jgi:hypothetical protein
MKAPLLENSDSRQSEVKPKSKSFFSGFIDSIKSKPKEVQVVVKKDPLISNTSSRLRQ